MQEASSQTQPVAAEAPAEVQRCPLPSCCVDLFPLSWSREGWVACLPIFTLASDSIRAMETFHLYRTRAEVVQR